MSTNFSGFTDRLTSPDTGIEPALWLPLPHLPAQPAAPEKGAHGCAR